MPGVQRLLIILSAVAAFQHLAPRVAAQDDVLVLDEPMLEIVDARIVPGKVRVLIDGALGDAFAKVRAGALTLAIPFPDSGALVTVSVHAVDTGTVLHEGRYRMTAPAPFERLSAEYHLQEDAGFKAFTRSAPEVPGEERSGAFNDFVAGVGVEAGSGRWTVGFDGEVQGTTETSRQLRPTGSEVDLASAVAFAEYQSDVASGRFAAGDVSVGGNSPLVMSSMYSRGLSLQAQFLDGRVRLQGGRTFGSEVIGFRHGLGLNDTSKRSALSVDLDLLRFDELGLTLRGSYYSAERPAQSNFNVSELPVGETNDLLGAGADLRLLGGRMTVSSDISWSDYENPAELDFSVSDVGGAVVDVGVLEGVARRHRLDATLWDRDGVQVSAYGEYQRVDRNFRSVESYLASDRRTVELGGAALLNALELNVNYSRFDTNIDDLPGLLATRESTVDTTLSLHLDQIRGPAASENPATLARAIPSSVTLSASRWRVEGTNGAELLAIPGLFFPIEFVPDDETETWSVSLAWEGDGYSTGLAFYRTRNDSEVVGSEDADSVEQTVEISHSLSGELVSTSASLVLSRLKNEAFASRSHDTQIMPTVDVGIHAPRWPDVDIHADASWLKSRVKAPDSNSLDQSYRLLATLDFSKFLPRLARDRRVYLKTSFLYQRGTSRSPFGGKFQQRDAVGTIAVGVALP